MGRPGHSLRRCHRKLVHRASTSARSPRFIAPSPIEPAVFLQIFIAAAIFTLYSVSVVLENLRTTERRLQEIATLHQLVTDNSRDMHHLADFDGMPPLYLGPAVGS